MRTGRIYFSRCSVFVEDITMEVKLVLVVLCVCQFRVHADDIIKGNITTESICNQVKSKVTTVSSIDESEEKGPAKEGNATTRNESLDELSEPTITSDANGSSEGTGITHNESNTSEDMDTTHSIYFLRNATRYLNESSTSEDMDTTHSIYFWENATQDWNESNTSEDTDTTHSIYFWANATQDWNESNTSKDTDTTHSIYFWANATKYLNESNTSEDMDTTHSIYFWANATRYLNESKTSVDMDTTHSTDVWPNATQDWNESNTSVDMNTKHSIYDWANATQDWNESNISEEMGTTHQIYVWTNAAQDSNKSNTSEEIGVPKKYIEYLSDLVEDTDTIKVKSNETDSIKQNDITMGPNEHWSDSMQDMTTGFNEHWSDSMWNTTTGSNEHWSDSMWNTTTAESNEHWSASTKDKNETGSTKQDDITIGPNEYWSDSMRDNTTVESKTHWSDSMPDDITTESNKHWPDSMQGNMTTGWNEHWSYSIQDNITTESNEHWSDSIQDNITTGSNESWPRSMEQDTMSSLSDLWLNKTAPSSFCKTTTSYEHTNQKLSKTTTAMVETDVSNMMDQSLGSSNSDYEIARPECPNSNHDFTRPKCPNSDGFTLPSDGFTRPECPDFDHEFTRPECPLKKNKFSEKEHFLRKLPDKENSDDDEENSDDEEENSDDEEEYSDDESNESTHEFDHPQCLNSNDEFTHADCPFYPKVPCRKCNKASGRKCGKKSNRHPNTEESTQENDPISNRPHPLEVIPRSVRRITVDPHDIGRTRRQIKITKSIGGLTSYAGFFQTNRDHDAHLFFWFFRNKKNCKKAPVVVWLQGEPGLSSLYGLFEEHGPYQIQDTTKGLKMKLRESSWINSYNVLYLDHCIGCGFSLARTEEAYIPSYENVGENVYEALYQFYRIFPEYKNNELYLAGSYGCAKYIPVIGDVIHSKNRFSKVSMNLKGMLIGAPYIDAASMARYSLFLAEHKIINSNKALSLSLTETYIQQLINARKYPRAIRHLEENTFSLLKNAGYEHLYDLRYKNSCKDEYVPKIVQGDQFRKMICLSQVKFQHKSKVLIPEIMDPVDHLIVNLLEHYKILFYAGQWDLMAPWRNSLPYLLNLRWSNIDSFYLSKVHKWCATNITQQNPIVNRCTDGTYRNYQTLTTVLLHKAGHTFGSVDSTKLLHLLRTFIEEDFHDIGVLKPVHY